MKTRTLRIVAALSLLALFAAAAHGAALAAPTGGGQFASAHSITYTVQAGDTWVTISKMYGVSASRLIDVNNMRTRPDLLYVGEKIVIPIDLGTTPSFVSPFLYTVQSGETVQTIVSKFYIDKSALLKANHLPSNGTFTAGQQILIPAGPHRYVVQKGDTIQSIAAMFSTTANNLLKYNTHLGDGGAIFPGNNVYVPIKYDAIFVPATVEGVGGGEGTTSSGAVTGGGALGLNPTTGLGTTGPDLDATAKAANALAVTAFEHLTMPGNVVNLGQPLSIRFIAINYTKHDTSRDNGSITTLVIEFRGGDGTYTVRQFVNEGGNTFLRGISFRGIYVKNDNGQLWNDIEFDVKDTCGATFAGDVILISAGLSFTNNYRFRSDCPSQ